LVFLFGMISLFCFWPRAWVYYKRNFEVWKESGWMERRGRETVDEWT
jgi:hypothetical protein